MNPPEPDHNLSKWLGTNVSKSSPTPQSGDAWWALPSKSRPRIYISTKPSAWRSSLGLVNSPRNRLLTLGLLGAKSLLRSPADWHETGPSPLREWLAELFPEQAPFRFAIYIGTPSIFVKDTIQCMGANGETLAFLKVPRGISAESVVRHEAEILDQLASRFPNQNFFPKILGRRNGQFLQAPPPPTLAAEPTEPGKILTLLKEHWTESFTWAESPAHKTVIDSLPAIRSSGASEWADLLLAACNTLGHHYGNQPIPHPMSHGDFIRWNILPGPFAFDWEWAAPRLPWHDAFHYLWMPLLGSNRCPGIQNLWTLWNGKNGRLLHGYNSSPPDSMLYCLAYLTIQFAFYAKSSAIEHPAIQQNPFLKRIAAVLASTLERF
jgi:hypothetical protein